MIEIEENEKEFENINSLLRMREYFNANIYKFDEREVTLLTNIFKKIDTKIFDTECLCRRISENLRSLSDYKNQLSNLLDNKEEEFRC